jgi:hypothetical protein
MVKNGFRYLLDNELASEKYVVEEALQGTPSHAVKCQKWKPLGGIKNDLDFVYIYFCYLGSRFTSKSYYI